MKTITKISFKKSVLKQAIDHQKAVINDFEKRIASMEESEKATESDRELTQQSINETTSEAIYDLRETLEFAKRNLSQLNNIHIGDHKHQQIGPGSLVFTDEGNFFISIALEPFKVADKKIRGISMNSPLYQEMKGKKAGDHFAFREIAYYIREVL